MPNLSKIEAGFKNFWAQVHARVQHSKCLKYVKSRRAHKCLVNNHLQEITIWTSIKTNTVFDLACK